jgi:hypothetical protein
MTQSKFIACLLCLTILLGTVGAQENQTRDSERLKQKIEEVRNVAPKSGTPLVNLTYRRTLLRRYDQYIFSLQQDIDDLKKIRGTLDSTDEGEIKEIDADIERLTKEREAAVENARPLRGETQESVVTQSTAHTTSQSQEAQKPCFCLPREERRERKDCNPDARTEGKKKEQEQDKQDNEPVGVFWCRNTAASQSNKMSLQELAERVAPILWFSPDERSIQDRKPIPQMLPDDDPALANSSVVYYRISHLMMEEGAPLSPPWKELDLTNIKSLTLQYYFYYPRDEGFQPHDHDLESASFDIHFTRMDEKGEEIDKDSQDKTVPSYYVARISRVVGAAHGVSWFDNILDIEKYTSLPMTLFVEEGKHASCPDRNADGVYSPGYDVNHRFNDAWGVRDIMATGEAGGVHYEASKTKPRRPEHLIMVAPTKVKDDLLYFYSGSKANKEALNNNNNKRYTLKLIEPSQEDQSKVVNQLKEAAEEEAATLGKGGVDEKTRELIESMEKKPKISRHEDIFEKGWKFGFGIERKEEILDALTVSYRYDGGHGFSFSPPFGRYKIPLLGAVLGGYVLPKVNVIHFGNDKRYSIEALYAPSVARSIDWYAAIGAEWLRPRNRDPEAKRNFDAKFVSEGGIRFRINRGPFLVGGRLGLRVTGRDQRIVFELGTGAF